MALNVKEVDASLFKRIIAYLIDIIVINLVIIIPLGPVLNSTSATFSSSSLFFTGRYWSIISNKV